MESRISKLAKQHPLVLTQVEKSEADDPLAREEDEADRLCGNELT